MIEDIQEVQAEALRERAWSDHLKFTALIAFPIIIAVLGTVSPYLWSIDPLVPIGCWLVIVFLYVLYWRWAMPSSAGFLSIVLKTRQAEKEKTEAQEYAKALERSQEKQVQKSLASFTLRKMSVSYIEQGITSISSLDELLSDILSPFYISGGTLFGFAGDECWSFSVYIYSKTQDVLKPVWRRTSPNHPSQQKSREWGRGEGHVGKAFVDRETIFTSDSYQSDVARIVEAKGQNKREHDQTAYRSFASVPFGLFGDPNGDYPIGVLVSTSNLANRFDLDSVELIQHFADTLGAIMRLTKFDLDSVLENHNTK